MQNNERSNSGAFRKFFQEKGYYIVLFLCILAVGISGYIFIKSAVSEKNSLNDHHHPAVGPDGIAARVRSREAGCACIR